MNASLNAKIAQVLTSYNKGMGKTDLIPHFLEFTDNGVLYKSEKPEDNKEFAISPELFGAKFLQIVGNGDKPLEVLAILAEGYLDKAHKRNNPKDNDNGAKVEALTAHAVTGRTAEEYRLSTIQAEIVAHKEGIARALISFSSMPEKDRTKTALDKILSDLLLAVFPQEKQEHYQTRIKQEEEDKKAFAMFYDLGLTNVMKITENTIQADSEFSKEAVQKVSTGVLSLGWTVASAVPNAVDFTMRFIINRIPESRNVEKTENLT